MPFSDPIVGGVGNLIRTAINSPNYVAGSSGWSINKDGSAEFNNVTVRGSLTTGSGDHITIPAGLAEVDFVLGANAAQARIAAKQTGAGVSAVAGMLMETSVYNLDPGLPGHSQVLLTGSAGGQGGAFVGLSKDDVSRTPVGPQLSIVNTGILSSSLLTIQVFDSTGTPVGSFITASAAGTSFQSGGGANPGTITMSPGAGGVIQTTGTFASDNQSSHLFTPAAGWSLTSSEHKVFGPWCIINVVVSRTGAAIGAGSANSNLGTLSFTTGPTYLPTSTTTGSIASGGAAANSGTCFLNAAGLLTLAATTGGVPVAGGFRACVVYFVG